ncbi:MAG: methyltransferase type 11, partial [Bacteroidota bacterium]
VHEIRDDQEKVSFLKSCKDVLKEDGKLVVVEHLRDIPNFFAFTIGFTHFFSKRTWTNSFKSAGFSKVVERKFTPFMSVFEVIPKGL